MCTYIDVSRRPHCAVHNLTGDTPSRASPDACRPPPHALWLSAGIPYLTAVCGGPHTNGDCGFPVLLALQRVSDRACISRREPWHPGRSRRSALHRRATDRLHAVAYALSGSLPQSGPACRWLVPHSVALRYPRRHAPSQTRDRGLGGNGTTLAPGDGVGVATRQIGGN